MILDPFLSAKFVLTFGQKLNEDAEGVQAIRQAAMATLGQHPHSPSTDDSDSKNVDPNGDMKHGRPAAKCVKHQQSLGGMRSELSEMKDIVAKSISAQGKYQEEVTNQLKASNEAYLAGQASLQTFCVTSYRWLFFYISPLDKSRNL